MNTFGDLLRMYIIRSGKSVYAIAKLSGVNRSTLQKVLSGDRPPSAQMIMSLLPHLILSEAEILALWSQFELIEYGETARLCHKKINEMINQIHRFGKENRINASMSAATSEILPDDLDSDFLFFDTPFAIKLAFRHVLQEEITSSATPHAYINLPAQQPLFATIFNYIHLLATAKPLPVIHQTALSSNVTSHNCSLENLDALSNILPCFSSRNILYQIFYYYSNNYEFHMSAMAFSYYVIVSNAIIFLNHNCITAILCRNPHVIHDFEQKFLHLLKSSRELMTHIMNPLQILDVYMTSDSANAPVYWFEFQPCLALFLSRDIISKAIHPSLPDKDALLQAVLDRVNQLKNLSSTICIFSEPGLKEFVETGILWDFPSCYAAPLMAEDRLVLLRHLYSSFQNEKHIFRIATPLMPSLPSNMVHSIRVNVGFDFCTFDSSSQTYQYLSCNEATTLFAFTSYAESLLVSPMVYSREQSMEIIKKYISLLES